MRQAVDELTVIGGPAARLDRAVRPGDRLIRSSRGEGIEYSGVVMSETVETPADLMARGIPVEYAGAGGYVEVRELAGGGARSRSVGRRLIDSAGRLPQGQRLVRAHGGLSDASFA